MYQAPEVEHLQKAVDAVKKGLVPEKSTEPEPEEDTESTETDTIREPHSK